MLELGKFSKKLHIKIAEYINKSKINKTHVYGNYTKHTFNKLKPQMRGKILNNKLEILNLIKKQLPNNSFLMIKGSNSTGLNKINKKFVKMLYNILTSYSDTYSFLNFFNFLTVRTGLAVITAMIIVFLIGYRFINFFSSKQITNPIRSDGPEDHLIKKIGTPTMGGVLILIGLFTSVFLWADLLNPYNWLLIFITLSFGILGAFDDYKKIKNNNSNGISSKLKILMQIFFV